MRQIAAAAEVDLHVLDALPGYLVLGAHYPVRFSNVSARPVCYALWRGPTRILTAPVTGDWYLNAEVQLDLAITVTLGEEVER
jgi:hypothetical protein